MKAKPKIAAKKAPAKKSSSKSGANAIRKIALAMPEETEEPHFDLTSFRVNKKIFATANQGIPRCMVKLSPELQSAMAAAHPGIVTPVPGTWGLQGSTWIATDKAPASLLKDLIASAWAGVASRKLLAAHADKLRK